MVLKYHGNTTTHTVVVLEYRARRPLPRENNRWRAQEHEHPLWHARRDRVDPGACSLRGTPCPCTGGNTPAPANGVGQQRPGAGFENYDIPRNLGRQVSPTPIVPL